MGTANTTTIDRRGRLVVHKAIREEAGLTPGAVVSIRCRDGRVEIEPVSARVRLVRRGKLLVAVPTEPSAPLSAETVRRTLSRVRQRSE